MKCRMVVSGLLCLWAVSQVTMPRSAEARGLKAWVGIWSTPDMEMRSSPGLDSDWNIARDLNPGHGTSAIEPSAPNPVVCKGGYRWGRVNPDDVITKNNC